MNVTVKTVPSNIANYFLKYRTLNDSLNDSLFIKFRNEFNLLSRSYSLMINEWRDKNTKYASEFNIFRILGVAHYEVSTHSAFLKELLDSKASHGQGNLFFHSFLEMLERRNIVLKNEISSYTNAKYDNYSCVVERSIDTGRIDIIIERITQENAFCIVIENKVYADDQKKQIERYWVHLKNMAIPQNRKKILYLTIDGGEPSDTSINEEYKKYLFECGVLHCISYKRDIRSWLETILQVIESDKIRYIICQYLDTINSL